MPMAFHLSIAKNVNSIYLWWWDLFDFSFFADTPSFWEPSPYTMIEIGNCHVLETKKWISPFFVQGSKQEKDVYILANGMTKSSIPLRSCCWWLALGKVANLKWLIVLYPKQFQVAKYVECCIKMSHSFLNILIEWW